MTNRVDSQDVPTARDNVPAAALRRFFALAIASTLIGPTLYGADLVVYAAGVAGPWATELTLSNTNPVETSIAITGKHFVTCDPGANCYQFVTLPANGTVVVNYRVPLGPELGAAYIFPGTGSEPSVLARAHVPGSSCTSVDLPVFRISTLRALNPTTLVLGGARRNSLERSNLLLANVADPGGRDGGPLELGIEARSADGTLLGQTTATLAYGETSFVVDILGVLGITEVVDGQIRITKISGDSVMWAVMPIARQDGSFSISVAQPVASAGASMASP